MAAPVFSSKGTAGATATASTVNVTCPPTVDAGDLLIIFALSKSNDDINVPTGFTAGGALNSGTAIRAEWFYKWATGSEDSSVIAVSRVSGTTTLLFAQVYRFTGGIGSGTPHEGHATIVETANPLDPADVTTTGADRLIVVLTAVEDDLIAIGDYTGGTATVVEAAEDATSTGTDGNLHVATVARTSAETFNPGSQSLTNNRDACIFSFALLPQSSGAAHTTSPADSVTLSDSIVIERGLSVADSVTISEAVALTFSKLVEDTASVSDVITTAQGHNLTAADSVSLVDETATETGKGVSPEDSITVSDAVVFERQILIEEAVSMVESLAFQFGISAADVISLADEATTEHTPGGGGAAHTVNVDDSVTVADALIFIREILLSDEVTILDSNARQLNGLFIPDGAVAVSSPRGVIVIGRF